MGLSLLAFAALSGCASGNGEAYPRLNQMPSLPQGVAPGSRQKIIDDLEKDQTGDPASEAPAKKQPAVPPKPAEQPTSSLAPDGTPLIGACEMEAPAAKSPPAKSIELAQAVPPLRGTLHGSWHAAVPPVPPATSPPLANVPEGEGITAAVAVPIRPGPLVVSFAPGSAKLSPIDTAALKARAGAYILNGGTGVSVGARGGTAGQAGAKPLAALSLGMKRTSAIADVLIKAGIGAEQIKMSAVGDQDIPALAAKDWRGAGPDDAIVVFDIPTP